MGGKEVNYVIIGNSASGISAIEAIRECDKKGKITVISDEPYFNYSRPLISYLLGKKTTLEAMSYRDKFFYQDNSVELLLNHKVVNILPSERYIKMANGKKIYFDKLLIATGGTPIIPDIKGYGLKGIFTFVKLADVEKIEKYINANKIKQAVIIGGGLIGLKTSEALIGLGIKLTIVELADRILSATFDKKASSIIESALEKIGCKLIANNTVVEIKSETPNHSLCSGSGQASNQKPRTTHFVRVRGKPVTRKVKEVILKDKKRIPTDMVIVAIGTRPNIELVKDTPIRTNKGIIVDKFMQTNVKDIYAAGDSCEAKDSLLNINRPIAIWPVAIKQGKIAGFNIAGVEKEYTGSFSMNSVELCGIPTISMGESCQGGKDYQVLEELEQGKSIYKKIVLKENKIVGLILLGDIERAGIYTGFIKDKVDVSSFKEYLLKEDFGLINLPKEYRKHLVGGEVAII